jgi:hypothetical protein
MKHMEVPHVQPVGHRTAEEIVLWSAVASVGLNLAAAGILAFAALSDGLGAESCFGLCGESHIGHPVLLGLVFTAGPAFYLSGIALVMATWIAVSRPSFVLTRRGAGLVAAGVAASGAGWAMWAVAGDAGWTYPVDAVLFAIILSVMVPFPLALPVTGILYAVASTWKRRPHRATVWIAAVSAADIVFGIYWWVFTNQRL